MPATAYHVQYLTFITRTHGIETGKCAVVSEYYFEEGKAIERCRQLIEEDSLDQIESDKRIPESSQIKYYLEQGDMYGRGRHGSEGNPEKYWCIDKITIH